MKIAALLLICLAAESAALAADRAGRETCFVAVPFYQGGTFVVALENEGRATREVTIQRYSAGGTLLNSLTRRVAGRSKEEARLDVSSASPEFGWIRIVEKGKSVAVSGTYEYLGGNSLSTISHLAVFRHPLSEGAVRSARLLSIRHRYTYDVFALRGVAYFFVNLSDYPVDVGMCQADYPGCTSPTLPHRVSPLASTSFPVDQQKRFLVFESTPGFSVATALEWGEGMTRIFGSSSSITFGPVK